MTKNSKVSFRLSDELRQRVRALAAERGQSEGECIRDLLEAGEMLLMMGGVLTWKVIG